MMIPCGMCGWDKPKHSMIAAEDGLMICARCYREYKDLEEDPAVNLEYDEETFEEQHEYLG